MLLRSDVTIGQFPKASNRLSVSELAFLYKSENKQTRNKYTYYMPMTLVAVKNVLYEGLVELV